MARLRGSGVILPRLRPFGGAAPRPRAPMLQRSTASPRRYETTTTSDQRNPDRFRRQFRKPAAPRQASPESVNEFYLIREEDIIAVINSVDAIPLDEGHESIPLEK